MDKNNDGYVSLGEISVFLGASYANNDGLSTEIR